MEHFQDNNTRAAEASSEWDDSQERSRTSGHMATGARRIFLFQSPLALATKLNSASIGIIADESINWNDTADLSFTATLPMLSTRAFNIRSHIGAIIVPEHNCSNTSLTLAQKLGSGTLYEHTGYEMLSSEDGVGKSVLAGYVRSITALEFCGHTTKTTVQLDDLIQELLRVDRPRSAKPPYRALYWNCHDVAIRFVVLAADTATHRPIVQALSVAFEEAKLDQQYLIDTSVSLGVQAAEHAVDYLEDMTYARAVFHQALYNPASSATSALGTGLGAVALPYSIYQGVSKVYRKQCSFNDARYPLYYARIDRVYLLDAMEQRFPQLADLGLGRQAWMRLRDQSKPFSRAFSDYWGVRELLFTRLPTFRREVSHGRQNQLQ